MIWLTGIVAIALMLAILAISPEQIAVISASMTSSQWQWLAYTFLVLIIVLKLCQLVLPSIFKFRTRSCAESDEAIVSKACKKSLTYYTSQNRPKTHLQPYSLPSNKIFRTPLKTLLEQGVFSLFLNGLCLVLFCLAVMFNTLEQRVAVLEVSPKQTMYVTAVVTPIGLSDKRLQVDRTGEVTRGYRQLVELSDIRLISDRTLSTTKVVEGRGELNTSQDSMTKRTINPFYGSQKKHSNNQVYSYQSNSFINQKNSLSTNNKDVPNLNPVAKPQVNSTTANNQQHRTLTENSAQMLSPLPEKMTVMLSSYNANDLWLNNLAPNQQMFLQLKIDPIVENNTDNSFDKYRWLNTRHATATAQVLPDEHVKPQQALTITDLSFWQYINVKRYYLREHFLQVMTNESKTQLADEKSYSANTNDASNHHKNVSSEVLIAATDAKAVTLSLLTGDRSLISSQMTELYRFAGISHLLAISGTHVLFLALLLANLMMKLANRFYSNVYNFIPRWQLGFVIAIVVAFIYAIFSGFDVPAARTAWMLLIVGLARLLLLKNAVFKILLILAVVMAWQDSFVLWQAGFWLSFVAVTVLIVFVERWQLTKADKQAMGIDVIQIKEFINRPDKSIAINLMTQIKQGLFSFFKLQLWMSLALLPISLWLFGKVSLWGLVVNLFAIGLFGWVVVPLNLLAGLLYTFVPNIADIVWEFIFLILECFHIFLLSLEGWASQVGWLYTDISLPILLLTFLMLVPWLLAKSLLNKALSFPFILAFIFLLFSTDKDETYLRVIPLNTNNPKISATLLSDNKHYWLLISNYEKQDIKANNIKSNDTQHLNDEKLKQTTQLIYDALKFNDIDYLTGVIGQSATPDLMKIVANLRKQIPISYYWQAGLAHFSKPREPELQEVYFGSQSCEVGKSWHVVKQDKDTNRDGSIFRLTAVTGWQQIADSQVWDCAIKLDSRFPIKVKQQDSSIEVLSRSSVLHSSLVGLSPDSAIENYENKINSSRHSSAIFFSSDKVRLTKLWALMCFTDNARYEIEGYETSVNETGAYNPTDYSNLVQDSLLSGNDLLKQHWLVAPQASIDKSLIDVLQPQSLTIISSNEHLNSVAPDLKETQLYWQQHNLR